MPSSLTYPGVYIEEVSSGVRTITGVATSITAFVGTAKRGPLDSDPDAPVRVQSFAEFERSFGGLARDCPMTYAVSHFFQNGGSDALIVRVVGANAMAATFDSNGFQLAAASPGEWGERLRVRIDHDTRPEVGSEELFNLTVLDPSTGARERFLNVSRLSTHARYVQTILAQQSKLVRVVLPLPATKPPPTPDAPNPAADPIAPGSLAFSSDGADGDPVTDAAISGAGLEANKRGLWALEKAHLFNLLCIPPLSLDGGDIANATRSAATAYVRKRRALFLADPLGGWTSPSAVLNAATGLASSTWGIAPSEDVALYFPRIVCPDPLLEGRLVEFAPCGAIAGLYARTDSARGVWKAPAGIDATLQGVVGLSVNLSDGENGQLNPAGVNCLRAFPAVGRVAWGARTLRGADALASEWKYVPVRRLALFLEETLFRGTQWVVFEPNDEPLWSQIRLNLGAFMQSMFQLGAFQGRSPREAYFVKCDRETTTQNDIDRGIVNIAVGFAPLKPAEFVVIKLQQIAGELAV